MIIGCGGVASVAIHKCCQNSDVFTEIMHRKPYRIQVRCLKGETSGNYKDEDHDREGGC